MKITENINLIDIHTTWSRRNFNVYFINDEQPCLIDTGVGDGTSIKTIQRALNDLHLQVKSISLIINTHSHIDHVGGDAKLQTLSGAKIAAHPKAIPAIEDPASVWRQSLEEEKEMLKYSGVPALTVQRILFERRFIPAPQKEVAKVNIPLSEETTIDLGSTKLQVIYTPGHSQDCICLYDSERKILFSGDHILKRTTPNIGNLTEYINSLKRVSKMDVNMVLPGHEAIIDEPKKRIDELIAHHTKRELEFLNLMRGSNGKTIHQLSIEYWGHLPGHHLILALRECRAHLEKLVDDGRAKVEKTNDVFYYKPSV